MSDWQQQQPPAGPWDPRYGQPNVYGGGATITYPAAAPPQPTYGYPGYGGPPPAPAPVPYGYPGPQTYNYYQGYDPNSGGAPPPPASSVVVANPTLLPAVQPFQVTTAPPIVPNETVDFDENRRLGVSASLDEIKAMYGRAVRGYFLFAWAMVLLNLVLFVPALIGFLVAVKDRNKAYTSISALFLGAYPHRAVKAWMGTSIVLLLLYLGCVLWGHHWYKTKIDVPEDHDAVVDDTITENRTVTFKSKYQRRILSVVACVLMCVAQGAIVYGIQKSLQSKRSDEVVSIAIALMTSGSHFLWTFLTKKLTEFEKHDTLTGKRNWDFSKILLLKLANVVVIYVIKERVSSTVDPTSCFGPDCACTLKELGYQFLFLLLSDMTVGNAVEVGSAFMRWKCKSLVDRCCHNVEKGDFALMDEFDVAQEHVELLYRQFLVVLGSFVFPLITIVAVAANLAEIVWDKVRLVKLCRKPLRQERPLSHIILLSFNLLIFALSLATFPNGMAWVLAKTDLKNCAVFQG